MTVSRPHSVLVAHVRLRDTHGLIGTRPGCQACVEFYGPDYWRPPAEEENEDPPLPPDPGPDPYGEPDTTTVHLPESRS